MDCPCEGDSNRRTIRAFIGGLDLTQGRFDWPLHPFLFEDANCANFHRVTKFEARDIHDWYNNEFASEKLSSAYPRQAWHDIHSQLIGPAVWDVVREFVGRWRLDPAYPDAQGDDDEKSINAVVKKFSDLLKNQRFVQQTEAYAGKGARWTAQIYRSITKDHWAKPTQLNGNIEFEWKFDKRIDNKCRKLSAIVGDNLLSRRGRSIQEAYLQAIEQANRFIYIETQYFIGCASRWLHSKRSGVKNKIPEALLNQILKKAALKEDFHVYLILPMFPEGDPASPANQAIRDYQWNRIEFIIRGLKKKGMEWNKYLTVGFLANWGHLASAPIDTGDRVERVKANKRYMLYVHSKLMIVDDWSVILGSANLNERSLAGGRDSEICVGLWPDAKSEKEQCIEQVKEFRYRLWDEHFATNKEAWDKPESWDNCAKFIQNIGKGNWELLNMGKTESGGLKKSGHFCCWPIDGDKDGLGLRGEEKYIIDGLSGPIIGDDWYLWPTGYIPLGDIAE